MELKLIFSIISVTLGLLAFFPYLRSIILKQTKPHEFTWLIWAITQGIAAAGLWLGGGGISAFILSLWTLLSFTIFLLSLQDGERNITKSDITLLLLALFGILIWWIFSSPILGVSMAVLVDLIGYGPTFRKSFNKPWSEDIWGWGLFFTSCAFLILAIENYNFLTTIYPGTILLADASFVTFLLVRRRKIGK